MAYSSHIITWQAIELEIRYNPRYSTMLEGDQAMAHIEVLSLKPERQPLPITETGYKSHFIHRNTVDSYGGAIAFVIAWLNHEAKSSIWQAYQEKSRQGELF